MREANIASKRYESIRLDFLDLLDLSDIVHVGTRTINYTMIYHDDAGFIDDDYVAYKADLVTLETRPKDAPNDHGIFTAITMNTTGHSMPNGMKHGTYRLLVDHTSFAVSLPPEMFDDSIELEPLEAEDSDDE